MPGPPPKPAERRARRNRDPIDTKVVHVHSCAQPDLPRFNVIEDGRIVEYRWPARTEDWWSMWGRSPLTRDFTESDWDYLLDTALLHARLWSGEASIASEVRLRVAKFGATPEDRARLRIVFAQADRAEDEAPAGPATSYQPRPLTG